MDVIGEIRARLTKYPTVVYQSSEDYIALQSEKPDGFSVSMYVDGSDFTVGFEGWHETFLDAKEALNCFAFGLSEACRLEVEFRGRMATKWAVQSLNDGSWVTESEVGLIFIPFCAKSASCIARTICSQPRNQGSQVLVLRARQCA